MSDITIFTPTYNRAYILDMLYKSLLKQTNKNFVWLIVDDGSSDDTKKSVKKWIEENLIKIEYIFQENSGKSQAHNLGVEMTKTKLFVCVDSDDYLTQDAVEKILDTWNNINKDYIGIIAFKGRKDGTSVTKVKDNYIDSMTMRRGFRKYGLKGDTMLVFKTSIIKKYKFPKFEGEKFVPESYLYDQLDNEGKMFLLREILYICEYLDDGYTNNMAKIIVRNKEGYIAYIKQRIKLDEDLKYKFLDTIRYIGICMKTGYPNFIKKSIHPILTLLTLPFGYIFYLYRYKKVEQI